jgi:hypothetical protein
MNILVACEYSGRVRDAMIARGHDAISCDFHPTEAPGPHYQGDVLDILDEPWDGLIAFPDCTHHVVSGNPWFHHIPKTPKPGVMYGPNRYAARERDRQFVLRLWNSNIPRIAIENPIGTLHEVLGKPTQIIQPWQFGHKEMKATCLWIKGWGPLVPTDIVGPPPKDPKERKKWAVVHNMPPGPERWKARSRTYSGVSDAMGDQWG